MTRHLDKGTFIALIIISTLLTQLKISQTKANNEYNFDFIDYYRKVLNETEPLVQTVSPATEIISQPGTNKTEPSKKVLGTIKLIGPPLTQEPINRKNSIVIPKISVNSPIVFDVSVSNKNEYQKALEKGVAHARGTSKPTDKNSNTYLFAHSTANEVNIAHYAAVFTKLNQLDTHDRISVFYEEKRYDYEVINTEVVTSFDTTVLTRDFSFPVLTLQTCDPPGVPQDRLIITSKLSGIYDE